jgi:NAD(P)-dependent dehydrogenase (short-subunit alcohol dehydrogenase family)
VSSFFLVTERGRRLGADERNSILVNNAGIADMRPFAMSTVEGVWRQVEVNFKGVSFPFPFEVRIQFYISRVR